VPDQQLVRTVVGAVPAAGEQVSTLLAPIQTVDQAARSDQLLCEEILHLSVDLGSVGGRFGKGELAKQIDHLALPRLHEGTDGGSDVGGGPRGSPSTSDRAPPRLVLPHGVQVLPSSSQSSARIRLPT
jgi:hypothetical protein